MVICLITTILLYETKETALKYSINTFIHFVAN